MHRQRNQDVPLLPITRFTPSPKLVDSTGDEDIVAAESSEAQHLLSDMAHDDEKAVEAATYFDSPDDVVNRNRGNSVVVNQAKNASDAEHRMTLFQGLRLYPKAVGWSMLISLCIAMEGFDLCLLNTFCMQHCVCTDGLGC
jgi:hypothetical protein